jgi:hypothetical protein
MCHDDNLIVVMDDLLLAAPVLEPVFRLAPDAVFDPKALLAAGEISERSIETSYMR